MKKLFAMLLAVVMIFSLATVSFASEDVEVPVYKDDMETVTVSKTYSATNEGTVSPAETFSFTELECIKVEHAADGVGVDTYDVPEIASVEYDAGEAGSENKTKNITITLPEYTSVGVFTYEFREIAGDTAGVTYYSDVIRLVVTVIQTEDGKIRVAAVHTEEVGGQKSDDFENVYSAGSLAVSKTVTGNLGDQTKDFIVNVEFTAPEGKVVKEAISYVVDGKTLTIAPEAWKDGVASVDIALKHGETVTFENIPYGVTYTVVEDDYSDEGYKATVAETDTAKVIDSDIDTVGITNHKNEMVDTGVVMDSIPYVLILAVAAFGIVAIMSKKRYEV